MIDLKDRMLILTANIIALFMAYYYNSIAFILLFYWIENAVVGVFNVMRMIACGQNHVAKVIFIPFFILHYGAFMIGHFIFLIVLLAWIGEINVMTFSGISTIIIGVVALTITHGMRFVIEDAEGELKNKGPEIYLFKPYTGIIVMHLTIIMGAFIYSGLGKPFYIIILIIALKTLMELYAGNIKLWSPIVRRI